MAPFRAITLCVFTLSVMGGSLGGQTSRLVKPRLLHSTSSNLFDGQAFRTLTANRVQCGFSNLGFSCLGDINGLSESGFWPAGTNDSYVFNSGIQIAGLIPATAGFPWANDTVVFYLMDFRGDQNEAEPLSPVYDSRDTADLAHWPPAADLRDTALFSAALLGKVAASGEDYWYRAWDGNPALHPGSRNHPMGVVVDQRVMAYSSPGDNRDMLYLVSTMTNVTASDPAAYADIDPAIRGDYAALGARFKQVNDSAFGLSIPTIGFPIESLFVNLGMDPDVGTVAGFNYGTFSIPFATGFAYDAAFSEPTWAFPATVFGAPGFAAAPGLVGARYLRYPLDAAGNQVGMRLGTWYGHSATGYPPPFMGAAQAYRYFSGTSSPAAGDNPCSFQGFQLVLKYCYAPQVSTEVRFGISTGPFRLAPGQQQTVVVAYIFAAPRDTILPYVGADFKPGFPTLGDSIAADTTKVRLIERVAGWVTQKDRNNNGVIEENEVTTWPGSLLNKAQQAQAFANAKFLTPQAPAAPAFFLVPGDKSVTVVWQKSPSETAGDPYFVVASDPTSALYDPNFRHLDVEGYRIYRGRTPATLQVIAQFDYAGTLLNDYTGEIAYPGQCAPEFGILTNCPVAFPATPDPAIYEPVPLAGPVVQVPAGGRTVTKQGLVVLLKTDTAVTGGNSGFTDLFDSGVPFSFVDFSPANSFTFYYAVTAFTVNSLRSGPSSLESSRTVKSTRARAGSGTVGTGSVTASRLLGASGVVLAGVDPTIDVNTGEFSGPAAPTNGLSLSLLSFLPELMDTGSLTLRVDSVLPGVGDLDGALPRPATYFLSGIDSRGRVTPITLPLQVDATGRDAVASTEFTGAPNLQSKAAAYGGDSTFALEAGAGVASPGTWSLTSPGRAAANGFPGFPGGFTGNRWWAGAANENHAAPTSGFCVPGSGSCTRAQLINTGGTLPGVTALAPVLAYSTVRSIPQRDVETVTSTVYRAADFRVYWGSAGKVDSVVDDTHHVPVPFSPKLRASWGILDSTSFAGIADDPDTNANVLTWSDVVCVDPLNTVVPGVAGIYCVNPAPLVNAAHLSATATATGNFGAVPASQGPGFIFYLAGQFWIMSMPSLPAAGAVWHARYLAGGILGAPGSFSFYPADVRPAAVPGLRIQLSYTGTSVNLTSTTDSALARIHTVPDPFYVTNALAASSDSQHIEFVHLPPEAIIRIYSVSGRLVAFLTHRDPTGGGEESWNVRSRDGKTVASGVYFYVVETADRRTRVGRFTVITNRP